MPLDSMPKSVIMTEPSQNLFICSKFSEQKVYKGVGNPISSTIIITDILHKHEKRELFFSKGKLLSSCYSRNTASPID
jgi:hypothetical protein